MWEDNKPWTVSTNDGEKTFDQVRNHETLKKIATEQVRGISVDSCCNSCTFPGGGNNASTRQTPDGKTEEFSQPFPEGETQECGRMRSEQGKCEGVRLTVEKMLHDEKKCNPMHCRVCMPRGGAKIKPGQTIAFRGNVTATHPQLGSIPQPQRFIGRYLCRDAIGVCFELIDVEKGATGRRMWLTDSGFFCEDLGQGDLDQIVKGVRTLPSGLVIPGPGGAGGL